MSEPIFLDTESAGLYGVVVLIQYAEGNEGEIVLFSPWENPVSESIELLEKFATNEGGIVGFNLAFDWFMLYKWWAMCKLAAELDPEMIPEENLDLFIDLEEKARDYPYCLKPVTCLDLFLVARRGPYQSTMDRKNVKIRKVPTQLAWQVAEELEKRVPLRDIYFARRKNKYLPKWQVVDRHDSFGEMDPDFKDIFVRFRPSSGLKALAVDALGIDPYEVSRFEGITTTLRPAEFGYAPFAKAAIKIKYRDKAKQKKRDRYKYKGTWPDFLRQFIIHWGHNPDAREYARNDVVYTRALRLHKDFIDAKMGDDDSVLACMIAVVRWRGFRLDLEQIKKLKVRAENRKFIEVNGQQVLLPTAPNAVKAYIMDACDPIEKLSIAHDNTAKITLEHLAEDWNLPCTDCKPDDKWCDRCKGKHTVKHPAAVRALQVLEARKSGKEIELWDKLLAAGRLHASMKVIGSLSGRMSGADGLNALGIKKTTDVKECFLFGQDGEIVAGGDFDAFEVTIAVAIYNDDDLKKDLLTCEKCKGTMIFNQEITDYQCTACGSNKGLKIHALFGMEVFPPMTYEEIKATDGTADDKYTRSKSAVFTMIYMGTPHSLQVKLGVSLENAEEGERRFKRRYRGVGRSQERVVNAFGSMRQPGGRGSKVEWHTPCETATTLFGFSRYFTLENRICKALFDMANKMPPSMKGIKIKVTRTDREQYVGGAAMSALFSAAFALQGYNVRAAGNHEIQGSGAQMTKRTQRRVWDLQPSGIAEWLVQPFQVHDSLVVAMKPHIVAKVAAVVKETVESFRATVPLIKLEWSSYLANWADKSGPICSYDPNDPERKPIKIIKNRNKHPEIKDIALVLNKQKESVNGFGYRTLTKSEIKEILAKK